MCVACNNPYHDCLIHSEVEREEPACNCTEGVIFYINGKEVSEEEYNNSTENKEYKICECQN